MFGNNIIILVSFNNKKNKNAKRIYLWRQCYLFLCYNNNNFITKKKAEIIIAQTRKH
jgi:hypothetical protein